MKTALITGVAGQDGSYLAEYLLSLGYRVVGVVRGHARWREYSPAWKKVELVYADVCDEGALEVAFWKAWPDEVYNLAGQVFVPTSWGRPSYTLNVNTAGLGRILDIVARVKRDTKVYQASSSEMFGKQQGACSEQTPFSPESPYGVSKLAAHQLAMVYRSAGLFVSCGILYNHESPRRGPEMVTRKISMAVARWVMGDWQPMELGGTGSYRDWGHAWDYVRAMHAMLQQPTPGDYVIGTGKVHSVQEFLDTAIMMANLDHQKCQQHIVLREELGRGQTEIKKMFADASKARKELGWHPTFTFESLVHDMVRVDVNRARAARLTFAE